MSVAVRCPACNVQVRVPADAVGRTIRCRKCHKPFVAAPEGTNPAASSSQLLGALAPTKRTNLWLALAGALLLIVIGVTVWLATR